MFSCQCPFSRHFLQAVTLCRAPTAVRLTRGRASEQCLSLFLQPRYDFLDSLAPLISSLESSSHGSREEGRGMNETVAAKGREEQRRKLAEGEKMPEKGSKEHLWPRENAKTVPTSSSLLTAFTASYTVIHDVPMLWKELRESSHPKKFSGDPCSAPEHCPAAKLSQRFELLLPPTGYVPICTEHSFTDAIREQAYELPGSLPSLSSDRMPLIPDEEPKQQQHNNMKV
ncbi:hypothetical protein E1301_Tti023123 [Triplophysa tibetana]|uniref:Uncharacterized protein n=1 Tax=Triplophysa tibetana TaxID=1572043 RepID=A0A5A9PP78_9TELE|nr:hypothetical protein E1301_Tti023123 [Triplophysa tibetana]